MRRTLNVVLGLLFLTSAAAASAQGPSGPAGPQQQAPPPGGEVRGVIMDGDQNTPVAKAQIAVRTKGAGALVTGAVTGDNGTFRIVGLRPGTYYLRVTSLGYGPVSSAEFSVSQAEPTATIGTIKVAKVAVALSDVEVKGERDAITIEPDKNSYKAKDVAATANNASEVLDHVPSVSVDGDGKVSLRGNENVVVQINGRPAPMTGTQLGQFLKTLPSAVLDRVEVITTPSARQDPEGMAGIINIVLKANTDLGFSGGLTVASATASGNSPTTDYESCSTPAPPTGHTSANDPARSRRARLTRWCGMGRRAKSSSRFSATSNLRRSTSPSATASVALS